MSEYKQMNNVMKYHFLCILIVVCALVLRVSYYMGPSGADDIIYFSVVEKLLLNEDVGTVISSSKHWGIRMGLIFPVWGFMKLFGVSEFSSYLFPMLASTGALILVYIAGLRYFNPAVALLSSLSFAMLPQDVYLSAVMYPDGPVVFFAALFMYLLYKVSINDNASIKQSLIAGLVLGIGYYIRETAVLMLVAVPILFFRAPDKKHYCKAVYFVFAGFLAAIVFEMIVLWFLTGDPLTRFSILLGETKVLAPREFTSWGPNYSNIKSTYNKYLFEPFIVILATHWISPLMILIAVGTMVLLAGKRSRDKLFVSRNSHFLWLFILTFGILAYHTYGPIYGLTVPLKRSIRYYHVITPFASLLSGVVLYELLVQKGMKKITGYILVVFYISSSAICLGSIINKHSQGLDLIEKFIEQNPAETYIMPIMLQKTLQLRRGLDFSRGRIVAYPEKQWPRSQYRVINEIITDVRKDNTVQYAFIIHKKRDKKVWLQKFGEVLKDKTRLVEIMTTAPSLSCRILRFNDTLFEMAPAMFKSRICYSTDVHVYQVI